MTRQIAERRKNERVHTAPPATTVELGSEGTSAVLKNISLSGLACITTRPIPEMTVVEMNMHLPALPGEKYDIYPFQSKGAVVRCEPVTRTNSRHKWLVAVFFTEMDKANKEILERYVQVRS